MLQVMFADKHFVNCKNILLNLFSAHKSAGQKICCIKARKVPFRTRSGKNKIILDRLANIGQIRRPAETHPG